MTLTLDAPDRPIPGPVVRARQPRKADQPLRTAELQFLHHRRPDEPPDDHGLAALRGGGVKFGHLSSIWASRAWDGDATAIVSTVAVIALTIAVLVDAARTSSNVRPERLHGRAADGLFVARSGLKALDSGHRAAHGNLRERHQRTTGR